jgi:hypothetical protein
MWLLRGLLPRTMAEEVCSEVGLAMSTWGELMGPASPIRAMTRIVAVQGKPWVSLRLVEEFGFVQMLSRVPLVSLTAVVGKELASPVVVLPPTVK